MIFVGLYFQKHCPIIVGSLNNLGKMYYLIIALKM